MLCLKYLLNHRKLMFWGIIIQPYFTRFFFCRFGRDKIKTREQEVVQGHRRPKNTALVTYMKSVISVQAWMHTKALIMKRLWITVREDIKRKPWCVQFHVTVLKICKVNTTHFCVPLWSFFLLFQFDCDCSFACDVCRMTRFIKVFKTIYSVFLSAL